MQVGGVAEYVGGTESDWRGQILQIARPDCPLPQLREALRRAKRLHAPSRKPMMKVSSNYCRLRTANCRLDLADRSDQAKGGDLILEGDTHGTIPSHPQQLARIPLVDPDLQQAETVEEEETFTLVDLVVVRLYAFRFFSSKLYGV